MLEMLQLLILSVALNSATAAGVWSAWQPASSCSTTCGAGTQAFARTCAGGDLLCPGAATAVRPCNTIVCPLGLAQGPLLPWSPWSPWTPCSATCVGGQRRRQRTCPGSGRCPGPQEAVEPCGVGVCSGPQSQLLNPATNNVLGGAGANTLLPQATQFMSQLLQNPTSLFQALGLPSMAGGQLPSFGSLLAAFPKLLPSFPMPLQSQISSLQPGAQQSLFSNALLGAFSQLGLNTTGANTASG